MSIFFDGQMGVKQNVFLFIDLAKGMQADVNMIPYTIAIQDSIGRGDSASFPLR